jgi:hypothetical protein
MHTPSSYNLRYTCDTRQKVVELLYSNTTMFGSTMKCRDCVYFVSLDRNFGQPFRCILIVPISTHSKDPALLLFVAHALVSDSFRSLAHALVFIFGSFPVLVVSTRLPFKLLILRCHVVVDIAIRCCCGTLYGILSCFAFMCVQAVNSGGMLCAPMYQHKLTTDQYHL